MDLRNLEASQTAPVDLVPREIRLTVSYLSPEGISHNDVLVARVPDGDGRALIDRRAAILAAVPWGQLSAFAQARFTALATISVHLVDLPDWVNKWAQEDDDLLFSLHEEVERHALAWFRSIVGEGEEGASASRISISSSHALTASEGGE